MLFALKSGQNFCSGWNSRSPSKSQNLIRTWLETVIVTIEFRKYPAKLKIFRLKSGQNFRSGSLGVLQNFKNWLETGMVGKSLRKKSWKCHFCQNLEGSTANFRESEMNLKKKMGINCKTLQVKKNL